MIIPDITIDTAAESYPSRTWQLDFAAGRVRGSIRGGMIDGNAAIGQAAQCALLRRKSGFLAQQRSHFLRRVKDVAVFAGGDLVFVVDVQPLDHVQSTGHSLQHGNGIHFGQ